MAALAIPNLFKCMSIVTLKFSTKLKKETEVKCGAIVFTRSKCKKVLHFVDRPYKRILHITLQRQESWSIYRETHSALIGY
jgi:hypothetical protein